MKLVQLGDGMLNHDAILGQMTVIRLVFRGERVVATRLVRQVRHQRGKVIANAIIALVENGGFTFAPPLPIHYPA